MLCGITQMWNTDNGKSAANAERLNYRILYSSQRIIPQKMVSILHAVNAANLKRNNILAHFFLLLVGVGLLYRKEIYDRRIYENMREVRQDQEGN